MNRQQHVVIIGGGIAGLSAAWNVQQKAAAAGRPVRITVLEQGDRWGGKIRSDVVESPWGDFLIEGGPDSFLTTKPWAWKLARELGLEEELLGTNEKQRAVFVLNDGRPERLPEGVLLIVPTKFQPFIRSSLISLRGKLRMGLDFFLPRRQEEEDETLADFVRRRLGQEALDKIAEPLMSGIYNADAERQSLLATFPRFRMIEQEHGSLIRGMLAGQRKRAQMPPPPGPRPPAVFSSFHGGTETLVTALLEQTAADWRLGCAVTALNRLPDGRFACQINDQEELIADTVLCATPAYVTAELVENLAPKASKLLAEIRYVSTGTMSLAYRAEEAQTLPDGFGVVIPRSENRAINAVTISSTKFSGRAPADTILLRVFFGGSRTPQTMALDDKALEETVRRELRDILGLTAEPLLCQVYRWQRSNPQYDVGHLDKVEAIEQALPRGLLVTGSAYRGVGLPDCVHQAERAAGAALSRLEELNAEEGAPAPIVA